MYCKFETSCIFRINKKQLYYSLGKLFFFRVNFALKLSSVDSYQQVPTIFLTHFKRVKIVCDSNVFGILGRRLNGLTECSINKINCLQRSDWLFSISKTSWLPEQVVSLEKSQSWGNMSLRTWWNLVHKGYIQPINCYPFWRSRN